MIQERQVLGLVVCVGLCFGAAALGAAVTVPAVDGWYAEIAKPAWTPPDAIFGPVWTALYLLMAVAAWWVWRGHGLRGAPWALGLFALQLALNAAWSPLFFGAHAIGWALVDLTLLAIALTATVVAFWRRAPLAGGLLVPYLAWVGFAWALNLAIWRLAG